MPTSSMPPDDITRFRHMIEAGEAASRFVAARLRGDAEASEHVMNIQFICDHFDRMWAKTGMIYVICHSREGGNPLDRKIGFPLSRE